LAFYGFTSFAQENGLKKPEHVIVANNERVDLIVGIDPTKKIWNQYATGAIPKNFVIDQNGLIRYISGGNSEEVSIKLLQKLKGY